MSAREVIAKDLRTSYAIGGMDTEMRAGLLIAALSAAGYRIVGPGELDDVTVTRCAAVATEWDNHEGYTHIGNEGIADAMRSLKGGRS